jgi:hypothetical protein
MQVALSTKVDLELANRLNRFAERQETSKRDIIEKALIMYFHKNRIKDGKYRDCDGCQWENQTCAFPKEYCKYDVEDGPMYIDCMECSSYMCVFCSERQKPVNRVYADGIDLD